MYQHRTSHAIVACTILALTASLAAYATPRTSNPCKQMKRDLDREIDDLKTDQLFELHQCEQANGASSAECLSLRSQQRLELEDRRNDRAQRVAGCKNLLSRFPGINIAEINNDYYNHSHHREYCDYPHRTRYPHKDHYAYGKDPDGDHYKHEPPPPGGGAGVKPAPPRPFERPSPGVDTASGGGKRDHATSSGHQPVRSDSSASSPAHLDHGHSSSAGGGGGGFHSASSSSGSGHSPSSGGGSSSSSGSSHSSPSSSGSSAGSSHSSSPSSASSGGGGASHSASSSSSSSSPSSTGGHPK